MSGALAFISQRAVRHLLRARCLETQRFIQAQLAKYCPPALGPGGARGDCVGNDARCRLSIACGSHAAAALGRAARVSAFNAC
eukprot:2111037-Amphidinium_carterae.1